VDRSLAHRLTALLVATLLLLGWTGEALGQHACPHHDSVPGAAAHAMEDGDHAAHFAHVADEATSGIDQHHDQAPIDQDHDQVPIDQDYDQAPVDRDNDQAPVDRDHDQAPVDQDNAQASIDQDHGPAPLDQDHHQAPAAESEHQHDSCTCLGSCPSAVGEPTPADPDAGLRVAPSWVREARADDTAAVALLLLPFFLPYGQAPPLLG